MSKDEFGTFNDMVNDIASAAGVGDDNVDSLDEINEYSEVVKEAKEKDVESVEVKEEVSEPDVELKEEIVEEVKEEVDEKLELESEEKEEQDQSQTDESEKYEPNFKYSVRGEEKEIPEYLKSSIVNVESETQIRDILTKVDGIDGIKEGRDKALLERDEAKDINVQHDEYYDGLNSLIKGKDWDNFYKQAGITENDILDHAEELLKRKELTHAQQTSIQKDAEVRLENIHTSNTNNSIQKENGELQDKIDRLEVETVFNREEVVRAEKLFDERCGTPNSFRRAVGEIGNSAYNTKNRLSVLEACQEAIKRYDIKDNVAAPATTESNNVPKEHKQVEGVEKRVIVRDVKHIPSAKHNASKTPVKRVIKDVDAFVKYADEYLSNQN